MLKVIGLQSNNNLVYQSAYLTSELEEIINLLQARTRLLGRDVVANEAVREAIKKGKTKADTKEEDSKMASRKEVEGDCPICFDPLGANLNLLTYCKAACGSNFHKGCIQMWTVNLNNVLIHLVPPAVSRGWILKQEERESQHQKAQEMKVTRILVVYKVKVL